MLLEEIKNKFKQRVTAGCIVIRDGKVLIVKSKNGKYGIPKGGVNTLESYQDAAVRETYEETGIKTKIIEYIGKYEKENKIVHIFIAKYISGELKKNKPGKIQKKEISWAKFISFEKALKYCQKYFKSAIKKAMKYAKNN
jgi:ADP-ribose pyrophosphatase YjhB (NUDIX family)